MYPIKYPIISNSTGTRPHQHSIHFGSTGGESQYSEKACPAACQNGRLVRHGKGRGTYNSPY
jgi:hypothetical protein